MSKHIIITDKKEREIKNRASEIMLGISNAELEANENERTLKLWNNLQDDNYDELINKMDWTKDNIL